MQIDMHYYGTYAMARAAGINAETTRIIATAAQFVDDNAKKDNIEIRDGARLDSEATAHHALNLKNIDLEDQRKIWVPFHFLPGNEGKTYTEKLICRKDSKIAREMIRYALSLSSQPYAVPVMGIAAHVYADTFAHYGFSGISSRRNKIMGIEFDEGLSNNMEKYLRKKEKDFKDYYPKEDGLLTNIKSFFAENLSGALGHGAAVTFPDRPYLKWSFTYEDPEYKSDLRDNPATFMDACKALHTFFCDFIQTKPDLSDASPTDFATMEGEIDQILSFQGTKSERIDLWKNAAKKGKLFKSGPEDIPLYDANNWHNQRENLERERYSTGINKLSIYHFYQAASVFRTYVLRELLPSHGLIVT